MLTTTRHHTRHAFTLLEMMLVVMIMGVLMGIAAWAITNQAKTARVKATVATLRTVSSMVTTYNLNRGNFPAKLGELVPEYAAQPPLDAWKRPLVYSVNPPGSARPYELYSTGPSADAPTDVIDVWHAEDAPASN
jgi:general secretion pathway protein G